MNEIKIYSRNIFGAPFFAGNHKIRINRMAEQAKMNQADIVLLQELVLHRDKKDLKKCFGGDFNIYQSKEGLLIYGGGLCGIFSKNIKTESSFVRFKSSGFFTDLTITDKTVEKGFQIFKVSYPTPVTIINTHLTCPYRENLDSDQRIKKLIENQLSLVKKFLEKETENPIIICGDFNLEITQDIMKNFIDEAGLADPSFHLSNTFLGNFYSPKWLFRSVVNRKKTDYVLTKNIPNDWNISVKIASDNGEFISDHTGIITTIQF